MICKFCGKNTELRLGCCFDCAHRGEARASKRTVLQHILCSLTHFFNGKLDYAKWDLQWAIQRLTRTGDYATNGYFDQAGHKWRKN